MTNPRVTQIYITWLNYLGGFDYFIFLAEKEYQVDILETGTSKQNIFPNWPNSWGQTADTIDRKSFTTAKNKIIVRSQFLTASQRDAIKFIKTSPVVQIIESRTDRLTVIVDSDSFKIYDEGDLTYTIQFSISYTNEISAQRI